MNSKDIEHLYEQQEYEAAIDAATDYLVREPADKEVLYIKARCLFELSMIAESETLSASRVNEAYDTCTAILTLDPMHAGALEYRAYLGAYSGYITEKDETVLHDCTRLVNQAEDALKPRYLEWRCQAHLRQQDTDAALTDLEEIIACATAAFPNELPRRNELMAKTCYSMGEIRLYSYGDTAAALAHYRRAFEHSMYQSQYLPVAKLAIEEEDYEFAEALMNILPATLSGIDDELMTLLEDIRQLYESNPVLPVALMYCGATAAFSEILMGEDEEDVILQQISLGKKLMQQFPEEAYFCNYTGRAFFRAAQYAAALPYLEKGIAIKAHPMTMARWAYCRYKVEGTFPETLPASANDFPYEWYEAGVVCSEWEVEEGPAARQHELLKNYLYGQAIELYRAYWFGNTGSAAAQHAHHFAMCCNNYGISLSNLDRFDEAIEVHTVGYNMSPFMEQLDARAYANQESGRFDKAAEDWEAVLLHYGSMLTPLQMVITYDHLISLYVGDVRDHEKAGEWYDQFISLWESSLSADTDQLADDEREEVIYHVNRIKTTRGLIESSPGDLPQRIRLLEQHLEQHPDDSDAYFNLMQLYFQNGQYEHCVGSASSRLSIGDLEEIPLISRAKIYYFRGKSHLQLGNNERALKDMVECQLLTERDPESTEEDMFRIYGYLAEAHLGLGNNSTAIELAGKSLDIVTRQNWLWDDVTAGISFTMASALKNDGRQKEAVRQLKKILEEVPGYEPAVQKLKEWKTGWRFF